MLSVSRAAFWKPGGIDYPITSASLYLFSRYIYADVLSPKAAHARLSCCALLHRWGLHIARCHAPPRPYMRISHRVIYHHAQRDLNTNHLSVTADRTRFIEYINIYIYMYICTYIHMYIPRSNNPSKQLKRSRWTSSESALYP